LTTDLADYRMRYPQNGGGAARAYGRQMQAWANFVTMAPADLVAPLMRLTDAHWSLAASANNQQFRDGLPFPVLGSHGPDGRKPIYADDGLTLIPTASIWEHALALVGMYGAMKVKTATPDADKANAITKLCRLLAQYGCFLDTDGWWFVDDIAYFAGAAPTFSLNKTTVGPKLTYARGGTATWTLAAMLVAVEWLPADEPLRQKAKDCCDFFTGKQEATTLFNAEWWAAVRSVTFGDPTVKPAPIAPVN
jgi:hypothetical protein